MRDSNLRSNYSLNNFLRSTDTFECRELIRIIRMLIRIIRIAD